MGTAPAAITMHVRHLLVLPLVLAACASGLHEENESLKARLTEREAVLSRLEAERQEHADAAAAARKRVETLQTDLETARRRLVELEASALKGEAAREELRRARAALETVHQEVARLQAEVESLGREIEPLAAPSPGAAPAHP